MSEPITLAAHPDIRFRLLQPSDEDACTVAVSMAFTNGEPMTKHMGVSAEEFTVFCRPYVKKAITDGLSLLAEHIPTGKIYSCLICEDLFGAEPEGVEIADSLKPVLAAVVESSTPYRAKLEPQEGVYAHWFLGATLPEAAGSGLSTTLRYVTAAYQQKCLGFKHALSEATNPATIHINGKKLGFDLINKLDYATFKHEGQLPFQPLTGHIGLLQGRLDKIATKGAEKFLELKNYI
eukprot:m.346715 g.346715  ORF g.346715 m.346715 type:complete len:236 (+) comp30014_c0_seq1:452-1159(+)